MNFSNEAPLDVVIKRSLRPGAEPRSSRFEVRMEVGIESESNFYAGFTDNMSECGVFVATHAPLGLGSRVDLCISLPQRAPIRAAGTVRWLRPYSEKSELPPGMGIRFDELSASDTVRIHEFTQARAPMFFDDEITEPPQIATLQP